MSKKSASNAGPGRSSIARNFLTRPPTGRYFHLPYPPMASQSISRDVPVARASTFCRARSANTSHVALPSLLVPSQGWGVIDLLLRACNEGSLRPRVARAQEINQSPSRIVLRPNSFYLSLGERPGCPSLRASNEALLRARVLRARRAPGRSPPPLLTIVLMRTILSIWSCRI